eukprot:scpid21202/ scgid19595/ 
MAGPYLENADVPNSCKTGVSPIVTVRFQSSTVFHCVGPPEIPTLQAVTCVTSLFVLTNPPTLHCMHDVSWYGLYVDELLPAGCAVSDTIIFRPPSSLSDNIA